MKKSLVCAALAFVLALVGVTALCMGATAHKGPALPTTAGYCVTVAGEDGVVVGWTFVPLHFPNGRHLEEFRSSVSHAVRSVAVNLEKVGMGVPHLTEASGTIRFSGEPDVMRMRPGDPSGSPSPCKMVCYCATLATTTVASGLYCGGGCKDCEKCQLSCPPGVYRK